MEDQRKNELAVIIAATVAFGGLADYSSIPYMVFGDFSNGFFISIALWWVYNSVLFYVAGQMCVAEGNKKCITKSIIFGFLATLIKAIIDTCIDLTVARQPNMLILVAVMEISMILYIIGLDYFLFVKVGKRTIKRKKGNNCVSVRILFFISSLCRNFILLHETSKLCC